MKILKFILVFIILLLLPLLYVALDSSSHKKTITIGVGSKVGAYSAYVSSYAKELKKYGVELKAVETKGSIDAQNRLLRGEIDFAFVQGGTENSKVLALANIMVEPIWIFYKGDTISDLKSLKGKRIAICEKGSGILPVTLELLNLLGVHGFNSKFYHLPSQQAYEYLRDDKIDAMFYISSANSPLLSNLIATKNIKLMNFSNSNAYRQFFIHRNKYFEIVNIYKHAYDIKKQIPKKDYKLLAKNTLLATYNSSDKMVRLMMKIAHKIHHKAGVFHNENDFPNASSLKMKQHQASKFYFTNPSNYYEENFNFWLAQSLTKIRDYTFKFIIPIIIVFAFFIEVIIPAFHLFSRRKINRWYEMVNQIDTQIVSLELFEAKRKREILKNILTEIRATDDIPSTHMADFYTLQNQIINIMDALDKRIKTLHKSHTSF
jgi:TRAP transporter TAXI family solute receptor